MNKFDLVVSFAIGAAIGSVVTWKVVKDKYEKIAQEEGYANYGDEVYSKRETVKKVESEEKAQEIREKADLAKDKPNIMEFAAKIAQEEGYANYGDSEKPTEEPPKPDGEVYVIPPEEFGMLDGYDTISLTYYADQILADDDDRPIDNVEETITFDSLTHFGEYEDDSVFVRNDRLKVDFEILKDLRKYADVLAQNPYKADM